MTLRGAQAPGTETITTALRGTVRTEAALRGRRRAHHGRAVLRTRSPRRGRPVPGHS
ncbi:hypothetical protein [Plantactinospora alkalitolerans]|uniref:hypothetical protein n=1 Tax=Plantactinospora alkalitolerans TaxID=2789879 RepID=UPI001E2F2243|nr:hypothetical protein [Plantactinospora alkalitolerans]